jgi:hypothetical protein
MEVEGGVGALPGFGSGHFRFAVDKGLELLAHLCAAVALWFRNPLHDKKAAAKAVLVIVTVSISIGHKEGEGRPLGLMELGYDVHLACLGVEEEGATQVVCPDHLAIHKGEATELYKVGSEQLGWLRSGWEVEPSSSLRPLPPVVSSDYQQQQLAVSEE